MKPRLAALVGLVLAAVTVLALAGAPLDREPPWQGIVSRSFDSEAPSTAPAHWLPPEAWVYNHWLPYDERRLYRLLGISRTQLWHQLRDDRRTLAELAARKGWPDAARLAEALVAPLRTRVDGQRLELLKSRALRTITQGHLAQHVFFHSLHQFAIPSMAPEIFGVSDARFRELRRAELSPLTIARLHGRSPGEVEALAIAVLKERARAGVRAGETTASQMRRLLRRQLTQLPRWLDQARYNGPPRTFRGRLVDVPRDYAANPAISMDGRHVAYEAYRQRLPQAVRFGEIAVMRAALATGTSTLVSRLPTAGASGPDPISAYNAAISSDGKRIVFESSRGNQNVAKRYGRIAVLLADGDRITAVDRPSAGGPDSRSAYNPTISGDGRRVAYQAIRAGRSVVLLRDVGGVERVLVRGARIGRRRFADPYEPSLSTDGSKLVYTLATGRVERPSTASSTVWVRDVESGSAKLVSHARGPARSRAFSSDPAISPDGRWVAFTSDPGEAGGRSSRVTLLLHDLERDRTLQVPTGDAHVLDPVLSRDARVVAFTAVDGRTAKIMAWNRGEDAAFVVSRGKRVGNGTSFDPSISADGRRVAFVSTADNLHPGKRDGRRAVFMRDIAAGITRLVSDPVAAYPTRARTPAAVRLEPVQPPAVRKGRLRRRDVLVVDNAFVRRHERPTLRVPVGARVTWRWRSRQSHSLAGDGRRDDFESGARNRGRFTRRFDKPGTYRLTCTIHAPGMRMAVVVEDRRPASDRTD